MLKLKRALVAAMFDVQIVRQRSSGGRLQALRRGFEMAIIERGLRILLRSRSGERRSAVISIVHSRIKSVRVRGRLLRVVVDHGDALTVRLQDQEEALHAAEVIMEKWDIDPLVEDPEATPAEMEEGVDGSVQGLVQFYMNDSNFRQLVHEIHSHIDEVLADDEVRYEARV